MQKWIRVTLSLCVIGLLLGCTVDMVMPRITALTPPQGNAVEVAPNTTVSFSVAASDPDGDELEYLWEHSGSGEITKINRTTATWKAPAQQGEATVTVIVKSKRGAVTSHTWHIDITEGQLGELGAEEDSIIEAINRDRKQAGLAPLQKHEDLTRLAREYSEHMARTGYFGHDSPTLGTFAERMIRAGYAQMASGENLALNSDVKAIHAQLMDSPGHRRNILEPRYTHVGIGLFKWGGYYYATEIFIGR